MIKKALEEKSISIISANLERIALSTSQIAEEQTQAADALKLVDKLEDGDDVQAVYHNRINQL